MAIPSLNLQKAIYSAISTKYKVYDVVPSNATFPYVTIGDDTITTASTKTNRRTVHNVTLHTFTKGTSSASSKEMNHFIYTKILDGITVENFFVQKTDLIMLTTLEETEVAETHFHSVLQFEFILQEVD